MNASTAGVSDGVVNTAQNYHNISSILPTLHQSYTPVNRNRLLTACHERERREFRDYQSHSPFDVAVNGHDYLKVAPPRCDDTPTQCLIDDMRRDSGTSAEPMMPSCTVEKSVNITCKMTASTPREERVQIKPPPNSSGALVLKKENKSWTVKLKTSSPSMVSSAAECTNGQCGIKGSCSDDVAGKVIKLSNNNNNYVNGGFCHHPSQQDCSCKCCYNPRKYPKHRAHVTSRQPSCCSHTKRNCESTSTSKTDTFSKLSVNGENGKSLVIKTMQPAKTKHSDTKTKKKKRNKDKLSSVGSKTTSSSAINGHRDPQRNFLLEGRKGEEAAYKALASTNGLHSSKNVKKAESEIARALEIIQLQLKVLQSHKKPKGSSKLAGKVTKKGVKSNTKKKHHSWEPSYSIDLSEVFPLPPSLIVKDGDLHPACSMRADPGCPPGSNHPIWSWRLGKSPLPRPPTNRLSHSREDNARQGTSSSR